MRGVADLYERIDSEVDFAVRGLIREMGVPTSVDAAERLADALMPTVLRMRQQAWLRESELILEANPGVKMVQPRWYPRKSLVTLIRGCAGLKSNPRPAHLEVFDPQTQSRYKAAVVPWTMPKDEAVIDEMCRRLSAGAARHCKQASRDLVADVAYANRAGWARVLTGRENCGFCAMLASRGPVYSEDTVMRRRDGLRYHDHCDCTAVLVTDPDSWDGKQQADQLLELWNQSADLSDFTKAYREELVDA